MEVVSRGGDNQLYEDSVTACRGQYALSSGVEVVVVGLEVFHLNLWTFSWIELQFSKMKAGAEVLLNCCRGIATPRDGVPKSSGQLQELARN